MVAREDPKSIKNQEKSILGPSRAPLCASLLNLITRMLPKDTHMTENGHLVTLILGSTPKLSGETLHIFKSFAHLRLQSQGGPAAGAKP